jgi:sugar phosphate isomerase/epimerase
MRTTLAIIIAGALALSTLSCKQPATEEKKEPVQAAKVTDEWTLGVQLWTFHKFDFVTAVKKADSSGLKIMEAFPGQKLGGDFGDTVFSEKMSAEARAKVKAWLQSMGMSIVAYGVVVPQTPKEWSDVFAFAKDMGIRYITAEPLKEHWNAVDSMAGATGIRVAIHDHPKPSAYWHPDSVTAAMKGRPNIGACADIGHWARNGLDPVECLRKLEGHIYGLHLKDVAEKGKVDAADRIPGTGVIDIPAVMAELKRQRFTGHFSIEHEDNWDNNVPDVKQIVAYFGEQKSKLE